jgi:hypothetical protein
MKLLDVKKIMFDLDFIIGTQFTQDLFNRLTANRVDVLLICSASPLRLGCHSVDVTGEVHSSIMLTLP